MLSAEAYGKAIGVSPDDSVSSHYAGRGDAYALLGDAEAAAADYGEAIKRDAQNTGAALSRAEVQIWLGQYGAAKTSLEALRPSLGSGREQVLCAWLMCHALNLAGEDFSEHRTILEGVAEGGPIDLGYGVRDIEPYLDRLDVTKLTETQISRAWMIQELVLRLVEPESRA